MSQIIKRFSDLDHSDPYVEDQVQQYLGEHPDMRIVTMTGDHVRLLVVFESITN